MPTTLSKLRPISASCVQYVHPWTNSCSDATADLFLIACQRSFKIYLTAYILALLMRGRIPKRKDVKHTLLGTIQSTAFLTSSSFLYSLFLCTLRRLLGNFNFLTVSFIPAYLASLVSILVERPSRRNLLCLYVANEATETVWNMAVSRRMVQPIKHGQVVLFSISIAVLLYYYRSGPHLKNDSLNSLSRFVIGPGEEFGCKIENIQNIASIDHISKKQHTIPIRSILLLITKVMKTYKFVVNKIKSCDRHNSCPHSNSCVFYTVGSALKMFAVGLGFQAALRLVFQLNVIINNPRRVSKIVFHNQCFAMGMFLGGFTGLFKGISCILRWFTGKDSPVYALPAGVIAGLAFMHYPDKSVALYVMWKMLQVSYNIGVNTGILPEVPGFNIFLYSICTATLFHAAVLEPTNIRPSYWKFLHSLSGGRIAGMARRPLDVWGMKTSESLNEVLKLTNTTRRIIQFIH